MKGYHRVKPALNFLLTFILAFFFVILLPMVLTVRIGMGGLEAFLFIISSVIAVVFLYNFVSNRLWLPKYREWERVTEGMGLSENGDIVTGKYRSHKILVDEINLGDEESSNIKTRYRVSLDNPRQILLYIKKSFPFSFAQAPAGSGKLLRDINVDDPSFAQFVVKGNREEEVKTILDDSARDMIIRSGSDLHQIEVGHVYYEFGQSEPDAEFNIDCFVDSKPLRDTKADAAKFSMILDTLLDIVEKVEASAS